MRIDAKGLGHRAINDLLREGTDPVELDGCMGQRFIAAGMANREIRITGVPGNALGSYLNGASITVMGNAQDAVGDTMNEGRIVVHGSIGDATGYAMRGGRILVRDDAGYRAGIHMKAYEDKSPLLVIGGRAGSFLGEYQAGGTIVVLGLTEPRRGRPDRIVGNYPCTGMHGGRMFLRSACDGTTFPDQVTASPISEDEREELSELLAEFFSVFDYDRDEVLSAPFTVVRPDSSNLYQQMYVTN